jgi:hypothetical protein
LGGVFAKNTSLDTKFFVSRLVFFSTTPPKHDIFCSQFRCHSSYLPHFKLVSSFIDRGVLKFVIYLFIMLYTSPWSKFVLTTSVVIGTDCIGSCKSNYQTITTMTAPQMLNKMKGHYDSFSRLKTIKTKTKTNKNPLISCNR